MNDRRGAMPFAVIAVAILIASVACGALAAGYERASEEARNVEKDAEAFGRAVDGMGAFVNRGLAEIIREVSVNGQGSLDDRVSEFDRRASEWLEYQFPMVEDGVRADLASHEVELGSQPLKLSGGDGYVPTYLKATGRVSVRASTGMGEAVVDLEVSTDGSCTLPLAAEQGSLFERMASEGSVSLSQMMSYQLTNLAQVRVLNGYGAVNEYGRMGTDKILTRQDVEDSYRRSMEVLGSLCFRFGDMAMRDVVDPADLILSDGGGVSIDIRAIYAQALVSMTDDIALKWYDYMYGDRFLDAIDKSRKPYRDAQNALVSFLHGYHPFDATPYLRAVMDLNGITEDGGARPGSGFTVLTVGDVDVVFENPAASVLDSPWLGTFRNSFENERSWLLDQLRTVLRGLSIAFAEDGTSGSFVVRADPYDGERFADSLRASLDGILEACEGNLGSLLPSALSAAGVSDPLYGAICSKVWDDRESYVLESEFESRARAALSARFSDEEVDSIVTSEGYREALAAYRQKVMDDLGAFESPSEMPTCGGGFVEWALARACAAGVGAAGISGAVAGRVALVCEEMASSCDMNSCGGAMALPGAASFDVERPEGGVSFERLKPEVTLSPSVSSVRTAKGECVHYVGFDEGFAAGYTTVFKATLTDAVSYRLEGLGAMSSSMGGASCVISGKFPVSVSVDVAVSSGWALAGVDYKPSCTVVSELWDRIIPALEPVLEPLKKVMEILKKVMAAIGDRAAELARYVSSYLEGLYEEIMAPLEEVARWAEEHLEPALRKLSESIGLSIGFDEQSASMSLMGYDVKVSIDAVSLAGRTKTLFTLEMSKVVEGRTVTAGVTLKTSGGIEADDIRFVGFGSIADPGDGERGPWKVKMRVDPFMKNGKHLLTVDGRAGKTSVSIAMPELVQYHELGLRLSDVPGVGEALSNIPLPLLGVKAEIDAGFSLKYSAPMKYGLIINEFEPNPPGEDRGNEWIELLNNSATTIDLDGYTLTASSDWKTKVMPLSGTIAPGEILDISPTFMMVNSSGKYTRSGEALTLKDPDGAVVDKTPTLKDGDNDASTWQRKFDGSTEWEFAKGSRGSSNGGRMEAVMSASDMKDVAWGAVRKAFGDVGSITDTESLGRFTERLVFHTVDDVVDKVSGCVVEASVYVSVDISDLSSTAKAGFTVALRTDSQLAEECLKFVAGKLEAMILGIDDPYSISIGKAFMEDVDLEVGFRTEIGFPEVISKGVDLPRADIEAVFRTNLSSLSGLFGDPTGRPETTFGLVIRDCPLGAVPGRIGADTNMDRDLWLMKATVKW